MVVADVYNHRFHKIYKRDDGLNHIVEKDDIFVQVIFYIKQNNSMNMWMLLFLTSYWLCLLW